MANVRVMLGRMILTGLCMIILVRVLHVAALVPMTVRCPVTLVSLVMGTIARAALTVISRLVACVVLTVVLRILGLRCRLKDIAVAPRTLLYIRYSGLGLLWVTALGAGA